MRQGHSCGLWRDLNCADEVPERTMKSRTLRASHPESRGLVPPESAKFFTPRGTRLTREREGETEERGEGERQGKRQ